MKSNRNPKRVSTYFIYELPLIVFVTIFGITFNGLQVFGPICLGNVINGIANEKPLLEIVNLAIIYVLVIFIIQLLRFFKRYTVRLFANRTLKRMRKMMYNRMIYSSLSELENKTIGDLMSRCIGDVELTVEGFRKALTEIFDTGVLMISYFITLMIYDYKITLLSCLFIPVAMFIAYLLKNKIYKYSKSYRKYSSKVNNDTYELIDHSLLFRNYATLENEIDEYNTELTNLTSKAIKANLLEGSMQSIYSSIACLGVVIVIILGAKNVNDGSNSLGLIWDIGVFTAYLKIFIAFTRKASKAAKLINTVQKAKISFVRIQPYLELPLSKDNSISINDKGTLEVSNLVFGYNDKDIIGPISFSAKKGDIIGVTGPIACGKSTLGKSLLGLYPYKGSILLNDKELSSYSEYERSAMISYSGHNPYLLSNTIKENVLLGTTNNINDVLDDVSFKQDLLEMKDKENTLIGNHGIRLSGGQQQRISLARALVNHNELIILDDPFSASDMKTEKEIIKALRNKYSSSIVILISHRLSIFPLVDHVLMFDENVKFYSHEDMLKNSELYKEIYYAQRGGDIHD